MQFNQTLRCSGNQPSNRACASIGVSSEKAGIETFRNFPHSHLPGSLGLYRSTWLSPPPPEQPPTAYSIRSVLDSPLTSDPRRILALLLAEHLPGESPLEAQRRSQSDATPRPPRIQVVCRRAGAAALICELAADAGPAERQQRATHGASTRRRAEFSRLHTASRPSSPAGQAAGRPGQPSRGQPRLTSSSAYQAEAPTHRSTVAFHTSAVSHTHSHTDSSHFRLSPTSASAGKILGNLLTTSRRCEVLGLKFLLSVPS